MSDRIARRSAVLVLLLLTISLPVMAQSASVSGRVLDAQARPVSGATVTLIEARRSVQTGADGAYAFRDLGPRHYHLRAESPHLGVAVGEAVLQAGAAMTVDIVIDPLLHAEEIVVTASADSRKASEVVQPVNVLDEDELALRIQPTLGETLAQEPGVASTFFGAGSSRPVIRGLGADRIRVLEEGIGTGDVSNISPDHAVSVDPSSAEQIEIVRGPATLLYGSNAVGGVVNVISGRIPDELSGRTISGSIGTLFGTGSDERTTDANFSGSSGSFAWTGALSLRDTNDYEIPGPADEFDDPADFNGTLENSSTQSRTLSLGGSWVRDRGFFGIAVSTLDTNYGVPGHAHHEEEEDHAAEAEEEEEPGVRVDLQQRRIDLKGELALEGIVERLRVRAGTSDYEHDELEGEEIGTSFESTGFEGRLEARHRPLGRVVGTWGAQVTSTDFEAFGEEAYIPANESVSTALFAYEELPGDRVDFQFGARFEAQDVSTAIAELPDRSFNGISASTGAVWRAWEGHVVALSLSRAVRLPTATELYANGPHAATAQYEVGNPNLDNETTLGIDLSVRKNVGRIQGELNLFRNRFDGYIFESPRGELEDELPVFEFMQTDATFAGAEASLHTHLFSAGESHVELDLSGDYVRASLVGGGNLPRIPPMRLSAGLRLHGGPWSGLFEVRRTFEQDRVADYESTTDGYTMVNASLGYRFIVASTIHDVLLRGTNLTDEYARSHVSPLKDRAPLPGRDISLSYRLTF